MDEDEAAPEIYGFHKAGKDALKACLRNPVVLLAAEVNEAQTFANARVSMIRPSSLRLRSHPLRNGKVLGRNYLIAQTGKQFRVELVVGEGE